MVRKKSKKKALPLLVIISAIIFTGLIGAITFQNIFPTTTPYVTSDDTVNLSYGIHAGDGLSSITHSWNGTNTTWFNQDLLVYYQLNNLSTLGENETIIKDISIYGHNSTTVGVNLTTGFETLNNLTFSNGKYDKGLLFNGKKAYTNSIDIYDTNLTINFSAGCWVKSAGSSAIQMWFNRGHTTASSRFYAGISSYKIRFWLNGSSFDTTNSFQFHPLVTGSRWVFVFITVNDTHINYYIDGILNESKTHTKTLINENRGIKIGTDTGDYMNGSIDNFMLFNKTLNSNDVYNIYMTSLEKFNESYYEYNTTKNNSIYLQSSFICSKNLTGFDFCSSEMDISSLSKINTNFSTSKGIVRDDFYGGCANGNTLSIFSYVTGEGDCNVDLLNPYSSISRQEFINLGFKNIRIGMALEGNSNADGTFYTSNYQHNIMIRADIIKWAYENNITVILTASYMPSWLANYSSGYCNVTADVYNKTCPPTNYTRWGEIVVNYINNVTNNGLYSSNVIIEVWNEPGVPQFYLNNLSYSNANRLSQYNLLYNATYDAIKGSYPSMKVIGLGGVDPYYHLITDSWLSNFSNKSDGFSIHDNHGYLGNTTNWAISKCISYGGNCSNIYITEFGTGSLGGGYSQYNFNIYGSSYIDILNINSSSLITSVFQYDSDYNQSCSSYKNSTLYSVINNNKTELYNITKNFAHLCPAGATVYVSSNDDDTIKQVSCKKGNMYSLIVINTDTNAKNITVNMTNNTNSKIFPYTSIMNYETGASIPVSTSGIAQLGVLDSYEVLYLTSSESSLVNLFKLNEYTGSVVYDTLFGTSNGTRSGATWVTDGVYKTLSTVSYTIDLGTGLITLISDYLYEYLTVDYNYNKVFGFHVSILGVIAGFLMIIVLGVGIIYVVKYFKNIKELE